MQIYEVKVCIWTLWKDAKDAKSSWISANRGEDLTERVEQNKTKKYVFMPRRYDPTTEASRKGEELKKNKEFKSF